MRLGKRNPDVRENPRALWEHHEECERVSIENFDSGRHSELPKG
jgi:hypothetical protein